jgi:hypothetical protein
MSSEKTLVTTHNQSDYGAGEIANLSQRRKEEKGLAWAMTHVPIGGLSSFSCSLIFVCSRYAFLVDLTVLPARSFEEKERLNMASKSGVVCCRRKVNERTKNRRERRKNPEFM